MTDSNREFANIMTNHNNNFPQLPEGNADQPTADNGSINEQPTNPSPRHLLIQQKKRKLPNSPALNIKKTATNNNNTINATNATAANNSALIDNNPLEGNPFAILAEDETPDMDLDELYPGLVPPQNHILESELPSTSAAAARARLTAGSQSNNNTPGNTAKKTSKPPPIVIQDVVNLQELLICIEEACDLDNIEVKSSMGGITRIYAKDSESYRATVRQLNAYKIEFHSYQLKEDKPYKVVILGLSPCTSKTQIEDQLKKLGHQALNIYNPKSRKTGNPMNMFFISLVPKENNKNVLGSKLFCRQRVNIEVARKSSEITQCHRCQDYGHTSKYCHREYICVVCGEEHKTSDCTRPKNTPATCALCGGDHPANFKGCEKFKQYLQRTQPKKKPTKSAGPSSTYTALAPSPYVKATGISYADMARSHANRGPKRQAPLNATNHFNSDTHNYQQQHQGHTTQRVHLRQQPQNNQAQSPFTFSQWENEAAHETKFEQMIKVMQENFNKFFEQQNKLFEMQSQIMALLISANQK